MINGHGDDLHRYPHIEYNFSSNVYEGFDHEGLYCYLAKRLDALCNYPEPSSSSTEHILASWLGVNADEVCLTNGATEAIYLVAQVLRRSKSFILQPTFSEYADACRLHEHQVASIFSLDEISDEAECVWLCCPNNPTGETYNRDKLTDIINSHPDTTFVIDASYACFTDKPIISAAEATSLANVIMIHSLTKRFALPGLRIGFITAFSHLLNRIRLQRMPWNVNQMASDAILYLTANEKDYDFSLSSLLAETKRVSEQLSSLSVIDVWPSDTHVLLCRLRFGTASALKDYLACQHGILIRDASNFEGLDNGFFRIAVHPMSADNDILIKAISLWLQQ